MNVQEKDRNFSKTYHFVIDSGLLATLGGSDWKVFSVINRFANYTTGLSYPTVREISNLAGVNKNCIAPSTRRLALVGLIERVRTGRRFGFRNCYKVLKNPQTSPCIIPKKMDKCRRFSRGEDGKFKPIPFNTENDIPSNTGQDHPSKTDSDTSPSHMDKKENREILNRDIGIDTTGSAPASAKAPTLPASENSTTKRNSATAQELALAKRFYGNDPKEFASQLRRCGCNEKEIEQHWKENMEDRGNKG